MEGGYSWTLGMPYTALVQEVLFYESETWVMPPWIGKTMGGFQNRVIRILTG